MSGFLLDTNIPSELIRSRPDPRVEKWFYGQDESALYLSVITIGELRRGFVTLAPSNRRDELERWFENDLLPRFQQRILPITYSIADRWGVLDAECTLKGTPLNTADGMIAATALQHGLTLVTRNVRDFAGLGVEVFNPLGCGLSVWCARFAPRAESAILRLLHAVCFSGDVAGQVQSGRGTQVA